MVSLELLFLSFLAALLNEFPCELLVLYSGECIACGGNVRETHDLNRNGRASFLDGSALVVAHYAHSADGHTRDEHVACVESTVLNQHGSDRTSALIQTCLDDRTSSESVGVSLELEYVCGKAYHLKQGVDALAGLSGNRNADNVAAPLLANEVILGQLFLYLVGVCAFLIHLVDGNDDRNSGCLRVVDSLNGLRHDAVVRCNYQDSDIGNARAARSH